jgi:hypothetical protein
VQNVTVQNNADAPFVGPLSFALVNLSPGVTLLNRSGVTNSRFQMGAGHSYLFFDLGRDNTLRPGEKVSATLQFVNPGGAEIVYTSAVPVGRYR